MIKVLLVLALVGFTALELRGKSSAGHVAIRRLVAVLILLLGVAGIMFPNLVTKLANAVGVGRGTDLVLYALVIAFLFSTLGLYLRLAALEARYVALSREVAIGTALAKHAVAPAQETPNPPTPAATSPVRVDAGA